MELSVSVIIPLYNKVNTIENTLRSITAQYYQPTEIIVVDDGSSDGSVERVTSLKIPILRVIKQENSGPGKARNVGIKEAVGKFVAFLDADDEWLPEYLQESVKVLNEDSTLDGIVTSHYVGRKMHDPSVELEKAGISEGVVNFEFSAKQLERIAMHHYLFQSNTLLINRETAIESGGFYDKDNCTYGEDIYFFAKLIFNYKIYRLFKPLSIYHTHNSELASGRDGVRPLAPIYTNYHELKKEIIEKNRPDFELWISALALNRIPYYLAHRELSMVSFLIHNFPLMKTWKGVYFKRLLKYKVFRFVGWF